MKKLFKDKLAELGITVEDYTVNDDEQNPLYCGISLVKNGVVVYAIEQKPRGWGGDGKFRLWNDRKPEAARVALMEAPIETFKTQREAIAGAIKELYNV